MARHLFLSFEPMSHLRKLVLMICGVIGIFGEVNVEALRVFGIEVVSCSEEFD